MFKYIILSSIVILLFVARVSYSDDHDHDLDHEQTDKSEVSSKKPITSKNLKKETIHNHDESNGDDHDEDMHKHENQDKDDGHDHGNQEREDGHDHENQEKEDGHDNLYTGLFCWCPCVCAQ